MLIATPSMATIGINKTSTPGSDKKFKMSFTLIVDFDDSIKIHQSFKTLERTSIKDV